MIRRILARGPRSATARSCGEIAFLDLRLPSHYDTTVSEKYKRPRIDAEDDLESACVVLSGTLQVALKPNAWSAGSPSDEELEAARWHRSATAKSP